MLNAIRRRFAGQERRSPSTDLMLRVRNLSELREARLLTDSELGREMREIQHEQAKESAALLLEACERP
jgi:hypothetical protein